MTRAYHAEPAQRQRPELLSVALDLGPDLDLDLGCLKIQEASEFHSPAQSSMRNSLSKKKNT
jgi:hypothetical protein